MNVEIGTEAAQFPEKEYINAIFVAVWLIIPTSRALLKTFRVRSSAFSASSVAAFLAASLDRATFSTRRQTAATAGTTPSVSQFNSSFSDEKKLAISAFCYTFNFIFC
jgi:hypothetical protein